MTLTMDGGMPRPNAASSTAAAAASADAWAGAAQVYADTSRLLLRVAYVLTGSATAAEDVVQTVFVRAGQKVKELADPVPYLRVAVVNECRSLHRRAARAPQMAASPDAVLDVGMIELQDALAKLPERQRAAIVLRYLCDLPEEEIASTLRCRRSTVRSLVRRGLAELREVIR